jgi:quercetin dioxygenase-like cupin family protein
VADPGPTLRLGPTESVTVRDSTPELLEVEASWGPGGRPPPKHFHPAQDERIEVVEGTLHSSVNGVLRDVGPGETIEIPRGAPHRMWNPGTGPARAIWQTRPGGRTQQWFAEIDRLHAEGRVGSSGIPDPREMVPLLAEYDDVFRLAVPAEPFVRGALSAWAAILRRFGYGPGASAR